MHDGSLHALLRNRASSLPDSPAILAPGRAALTYRGLLLQADTIGRFVAAQSKDRSTRVAVALPNGPEMAVACVGVATYRPCIPLNPLEPRAALRLNLQASGAAVIVAQDGAELLIEVARELGLLVLIADPQERCPAGSVSMRSSGSALVESEPASTADPSEGHDTALVFQTSGTTSRPKVVRLSHRNVLSVATQVAHLYRLGSADRCLSVMPLSHSHALIFALMSVVVGGGSIVCAPRFHQDDFFRWIAEFSPTWYTAVPSIHQAVISNADSYRRHAPMHRFRFVASGSASLSPATLARLESVVGAPVIESYGLTETATVFTSNPMLPGIRKPGSVGLPIGSEVAILDAAGNPLPSGTAAEICARGPGVMLGYDDPDANEAAFVRGWFRTGDQGYLDEDGYLFITGRIKEMVNRGGKKISPREIDDALLEIPGVEQAGAFGFPHPSLGEDLAAAVVCASGSSLDAASIRSALAERLPEYKVPSRIVFTDQLPRTNSGKLQRTRLADLLLGTERMRNVARPVASESGNAAQSSDEPVREFSENERLIAEVWSELLGTDDLRPEDNFYDLGGHSLLAAQAMERIEMRTGVRLRAHQFSLESLEQLALSLAGPATGAKKVAPAREGLLRRLFGRRTG
jgi:acyl-CoA synthetase (AMP-forming)/AMP-acid ligase II